MMATDYPDALALAHAEIARLAAELAEARKDAERYRWLRDGPSPAVDNVIRNTDPLRWDAAIDAAISGALLRLANEEYRDDDDPVLMEAREQARAALAEEQEPP